jgi:hypothetical protein
MLKKSSICILLFIFILSNSFASEHKDWALVDSNPFMHSWEINVIEKQWIDVNNDFDFTAISFKLKDKSHIPSLKFVTTSGDTISLKEDEHYLGREEDYPAKTNLLIFDHLQTGGTLYSGTYSGSIKMYQLNAAENLPDEPMPGSSGFKKDSPCSPPEKIPQEDWRDGLPEPTGTVLLTQVKHLIVHHSAGSNFNFDYRNTVRNIYLDHTQINGWSDIGYNYLIAADGSVFSGRDGRGTYEDHNTQGAHFCAKNSATMGICMIGTFTDTLPSDSAYQRLIKLAAWKLDMENITAFDSTLHPPSDPNAYYLDAISGHRDGCATECPGTLFYAEFQLLRDDIQDYLNNCQLSHIFKTDKEFNRFSLYPVPANSLLHLEWFKPLSDIKIRIFDLNGKVHHVQIDEKSEKHQTLLINQLKSGIYFLEVNTGNHTEKLSFIKK